MKRCASRSEWAWVAGLLVLGWGATARADVWEFAFRTEDGKVLCERTRRVEDVEPDALLVRVKKSPEVRAPVLQVEGGPEGGLPLKAEAEAEAFTLRIPKEKLPADGTLQVKVAAAECDPFRSPRAQEPGNGDAGDKTEGGLASEVWAWWQQQGVEQLEQLKERGGFPKSTRFLVHYGTGERAAPFPASVSEREQVQVVVIAEQEQPLAAELVVNTCEDVLPFRMKNLTPEVVTPQGKRQRTWQLIPVGPLLRCGAGTLSYTLKLGSPAVDTLVRMRVRPVQHLAATVAYGFDFVQRRSYGVMDGRVVEERDPAGLGLRLGLTWFPWGVDYEDMRPYNYFANFVFAVDPEAPTESFMTGVAVTPTGGVSLLLGVSYQRLSVLQGLEPGAEFTGMGAVPTRKEWSTAGIRPFIGLSLDDDVYTALKGRFSGGN